MQIIYPVKRKELFNKAIKIIKISINDHFK